MKQKIEIVLRLLTEGQITVEEGVILLENINTTTFQEFKSIPPQSTYPFNPLYTTFSSDLGSK